MHQFTDNRLKEIGKELEFHDSEKFELVDGLVYRKDGNNLKFAVPNTMVDSLLRVHYDEMAHCGVEKTVKGLAQNYWFPSMRKRVINYIDNCLTCITANDAMNRRVVKARLRHIRPPRAPWRHSMWTIVVLYKLPKVNSNSHL